MYENALQSKLFDHDNMKYLKKLLDELENVMDQVETELQRRVEETPGTRPQGFITYLTVGGWSHS